jgi:tRNA U54 and U55 pseudouridine synthase Pus10
MAEPSCLVNCTIPVKLRDYLKELGINRSELFRKAALDLYEHKICTQCYGKKIADTYKGKFCRDCDHWLLVKRCLDCDELYSKKLHGMEYEGRIICHNCFRKYDKKLNDFFNKELSKVDKEHITASDYIKSVEKDA